MVFESLVTDLINRFVGQYIENLDHKQLKIGIWGGDVVLNNLKVRANALDDLDLPIKLLHGYLGKLVLKIPWKNLYSQAIVAQVEDLHILIAPGQMVQYNNEKEEENDLLAKQKALKALDEAHQKELEKGKVVDPGLQEKLTARIVNNVQVKIANVHVRYEDTTTTAIPFAFGITLHNLELFTTNENWQKCYVAEVVSRVFKLMTMDSFSLYMNCTAITYSTHSFKEVVELFRQNIASKESKPSNYSYVLGPISAQTKLSLNLNPSGDNPPFVIPKLDLVLDMESLNVAISSTQNRNIISLLDAFNRMTLGLPYRKYRPYNIPYKGHSKEWWNFAITAVLEEQVRKNIRVWTWNHMHEHHTLCKNYAEAHKERCLTTKPPASLVELCTLAEKKLDLFNLILIRKRIQLEVDRLKEQAAHKKEEQKKAGWFSGWFSSKREDEADDSDIKKKFQAAMTPEEKNKLYKAIGYQENTAPLELPEHYEAICLSFKLNTLEVTLFEDNQPAESTPQTVLKLTNSTVIVVVKQRPAANALHVTGSMNKLKITGYKTPDNPLPVIVESKIMPGSNLLDFFFETNPLDKQCDQRIRLKTRPLQIVYNAKTILQLLKCFTPKDQVNLKNLEGATTLKISNFKERSATGLQYMIESHSIMDIDVTLMPNIFILPYAGVHKPGRQTMIVVSLGKLQFSSRPHRHMSKNVEIMHKSGQEADEIMQMMMLKAYDHFNLTIEDVQLVVVNPREDWENVIKSASDSCMHILRPTALIVDVELCVVEDDPRLPKTRIEILLPSIVLNFVDERIMTAIHIGLSIPLPEKEEAAVQTPPRSSLRRTSSQMTIRRSIPGFLNQMERRKRLANSVVVAEVVQYTSLEINFALKKFTIILLKELALDSPGSDDSFNDEDSFNTPEEEEQEEVGDNVNDETKTISSVFFDTNSQIITNPLQSIKLIAFQVTQLEVHMAQRTFETVIKAKLGDISLKFYENVYNKPEVESIMIETPGFIEDQQSLLKVSYTMVDKATPDFVTKYKSVVQLIEVQFAILNIILHQENILSLLEVVAELQSKLEKIKLKTKGASPTETPSPKDRMATANNENVLRRLSMVAEDNLLLGASMGIEPIPISGRKSPRESNKVVQSIDLKLVAELKQVGLELTCTKRSLSKLTVSSLHAGVILKSAYTEVELGLKDINLEDMNPVTLHPNFLSIVGQDALTGKVVLYEKYEAQNLSNKVDVQVDFNVGCMKIIFVNWYVNSILSFLNNFQAAQQAIADAGARAADKAKHNVLDTQEVTRMKLNIKVKAPVIIVPIDSQSFEAILVDMGQLSISNVLSESYINFDGDSERRGIAVFDDIKIILSDMKITRVVILSPTKKKTRFIKIEEKDEVDYELGYKSNMNILNKSSFTLNFKRNLSFNWYKNAAEFDISGALKALEMHLLMDDYGLIMSILNRNMREGINEFPQVRADTKQKLSVKRPTPPHSPVKLLKEGPLTRALDKFKEQGRKALLRQRKTHEQMRFNFQLDGIILNLMTNNTTGLARFGLYFISVKGNKLNDDTLTTNVVLCNMQLDDIRTDLTSEITTYLCRTDWLRMPGNKLTKKDSTVSDRVDHCFRDTTYMLDFTCAIKQNETIVKVRVSSFDLILCVDFLLNLSEFFKTPIVAEAIVPEKEKAIVTIHSSLIMLGDNQLSRVTMPIAAEPPMLLPTSKSWHTTTAALIRQAKLKEQVKEAEKDAETTMNISVIIDEPNIILVETLEDMNTSAIIFNLHSELNYRTAGDKQIIKGTVDGLKMYMCSFLPERRENTRHYILHPCVITLQGSTPDDEGLHISINFTDIIINISPGSLELVNKAVQSVSAQSIDKTIKAKKSNYDSIWQPKPFRKDQYWFVQVDEAEEAFEDNVSVTTAVSEKSTIVAIKSERCVLEMPCIVLVLETGIGYYAQPVISLDTRLNAIANNWSSNLSVSGSLCLNMNYYNQALGVWEPVIELNEHAEKSGEKVFVPWELTFSLGSETKMSQICADKEECTQVIRVKSAENLEISVSKTFLNVLSSLGEAFNQAMDPKGLIKPEVVAPYVVENDTGFDVTLHFTSGIFTLHECHMPTASPARNLNRSLIFHTKAKNKTNIKPEDVKTCKISSGGKVYLQTKTLSKLSGPEEEEYNLHVTVGHIAKMLVLPVTKVDKRYFSLFRDINQDPWGIVSEVSSEYGTTVVNIHGVLDIYNHFTTTVKVYRVKHSNREMILIGTVAPNSTFHVPLHAIYSQLKYIHFAIEEYAISAQGIKWDDSPTDMNYNRVLQCDPKLTLEPFYIIVNREKTEIYHEQTNKFKLLSAYYTLHLRPPLYLRNALPINISVSMAGCVYRDVEFDEETGERRRKRRPSTTSETDISSEGTPKMVNKQTSKPFDSSTSTDDPDGHTYLPYSSMDMVKEELLNYGEKEIESGTILQLPTLKLAKETKELKTFLVIRMIQYLEKDWSCTTEIPEEHDEYAVWKFHAYDSEKKMTMELCVKFDDRFGSLIITLFSPFWLINKTGQMLSYKTDSESVEVLYHPPEYTGPILYAFREKHLLSKKSCSIRVDTGEWSNKIPLDVAGSSGSVSCKSFGLTYQVGVHNHMTNNSLTKQITFIPFYTVTNKCGFTIEIQEHTRPADSWKKIAVDQTYPWWPKNDSDHMFVVKVGSQRTVPFKYSDPVQTLLQLNNNKYGGVNVDVQNTEGGVYITFTEYNPGDAPGLLLNHTRMSVTFREKNVGSERSLLPSQKVLYTWADPAGERRLIFGQNKAETDLRRDGVGELILENNTKAFWVSFLDDLQRVLLFTESEEIASRSESTAALQTISHTIQVKIHGIGLSLLNNETGMEILYLGITSSGIIWESKKEKKQRFKQMNMHDTAMIEALYQEYLIDKGLRKSRDTPYTFDEKQQVDFDEMILTKSSGKRSLRRTFLPGVWISLETSPFQTQIHIKINRIQLDNQLFDCVFPVVLAPIPPPKTLAKTIHFKPFIECSVVQRIVPNSTVKQFKYASILVQEFHVKADLLFVVALLDFLAKQRTEEEEVKLFRQDVESIEKPLEEVVQVKSLQEQKNFYDHLHLGPMKVHVSFSLAGVEPSALPGLISRLVQGVGVTLTDVNDVVIRLAFFEREYMFYTQGQLISDITSHYTGQALKQIYVLILGLDVLGNPFGLVVGIKKGVEDLFYEPFQGAIQGPGEFAEGLVLGVRSLFGHTVGGAAGAVSKITGAMGKGLAVLTFDDDYQKKRRRLMTTKPKSFHEGMARSGKGLVMGFVEGISGVVTKPITGARDEGVEGFFKGLGKGTIGLVTRPTAGIVDFAHGTFDSVKRATEIQVESKRLRPPRFLHHDKVLRPYSRDDAKGSHLLREVDKGKYATTDSFIYCEEVIPKREYLLVTNHRLLYVTHNDVFGSWTVNWTYLHTELARLASTDKGIEIHIRRDHKKMLGVFSGSDTQSKQILIGQRVRREKLLYAIESQRLGV